MTTSVGTSLSSDIYDLFKRLILITVFEAAPVVDKRNFDGFMDCEFPGQPSFEEHVRVGPLPGVSHLLGSRGSLSSDRL